MAALIDDDEGVERLLRGLRRVAVLGIKTEEQASAPAYYVAAALQALGLEIVPVPVYYPDATFILGEPVFRRVADVPGSVDCVDVFRRAEQLVEHLDDLVRARPRAVWLQSGIRNDAFASGLVAEGIDVVQDRCLLVEYRRLLGG